MIISYNCSHMPKNATRPATVRFCHTSWKKRMGHWDIMPTPHRSYSLPWVGQSATHGIPGLEVVTRHETQTPPMSRTESKPKPLRVGIMSSQRQPTDPYTWLRVHVDAGIRAFYIMFEDSEDVPAKMQEYATQVLGGGRPKKDPASVIFYYETRDVDRSKEKNYMDLMARQEAWVNKAIGLAKKDGVDWVFHIDDDEVAFPGSDKGMATWPEVLAKELDPGCMSVHVQNIEAFSPAQPAASYLRDSGIRFLPRGCAHLYAAYANGKSATRTVAPQRAAGPHYFQPGKTCELDAGKGVIGHFEGLSSGAEDSVPPERWTVKHQLRVRDDLSKIPFEATREGVAAVQSGDADLMARTWEQYRTLDGERFKACSLPALALPLPSYRYDE